MKRLFRSLIVAALSLAAAVASRGSGVVPARAAPQYSPAQIVLDTPVLVYPANGATISDSTPSLDWDIVLYADHYQIQVDNDSDFSSPVIDEYLTATFTGYTPPTPLAGGTYYWRVQAMNLSGDFSDWSTRWTFTIADGDRIDVGINDGWRFHYGDVAGAQDVGFDDSAWTLLDVPHTWNALDAQDGGNNYARGIGWYRKHYTVPANYGDKRIYIRFEAVSKSADVYVNGTLVGRHEGAFAAFAFDITSLVVIGGDNVIAVKANNTTSPAIAPLSGDFNMDGGIFRPVHLLVTNKVHVTPLDFASPGVYLTPLNVSASSADLRVTAKIANRSGATESVTVETTVKDANGTTVATVTSVQDVASTTDSDFNQNTTIANPHLWNGRADPYLYQAVVKVIVGGVVVDQVTQPLGFRYFSLDPTTGFSLNGQPLDLHGVAMHEGRLNKGRAISDADRAEDIALVMEMGATTVRLAHYQHAETTYDLTDENGLVVWTEIPLVNSVSTSTVFTNNAAQQMKELIRQNYNHPSIFFWGLYNEISINPTTVGVITTLNNLAHAEDPTRPTTAANLNSISASAAQPTDLVSWNLYYGWYSGTPASVTPSLNNIHANHPYLGVSEYGAGASIIHHEENPVAPITTGKWHPEEYQNLFHESYWSQMSALPYLWQKTIWVGFDFAVDSRNEGDTPGRNDKGMVTIDRAVKKDSFYWYKANWSEDPVVYITSRRFTFRYNNVVEVKVYSNCDSVELLLNGVSQGSLTSTDHIYKWPGVHLGAGSNTITASCLLNGDQYEDTVVWDTGPALTALEPGLHQETDADIVYTGSWSSYVGPEPNGGSLLKTPQHNAVARFDFRGTELRLYRTKGSTYGSMQVCIDGVCQAISNNNSTTLWNQMVVIASGLSNGVHRATIRNINVSGSAVNIDLDAVEVIGPPEVPALVAPSDASTTTDNTPTFDWQDVPGATGYHIQVATDAAFSSIVFETDTSASNYTPASALSDAAYFWRVRAGNTLWSDYSDPWSVTIAILPGAPSALTAASVTLTRVDLTWMDNSSSETGFKVQRSPAGAALWSLLATTGPDVVLFSDTTAACGTAYIYRVIATGPSGDSLPSNTAGATTSACLTGTPGKPKITLPAKTLLTNDDTPDFGWTSVANAATYHIQISSNPRFTNIVQEGSVDSPATTAEHLDDGVYYVRVRGVNSLSVAGKWSAARKVTVDTTPPSIPALKTPLDGALIKITTPTLNALKVKGAARYWVQLSSSPDFGSPLLDIVKKGSSARVPASLGLAHGATYYWRVAAIDKAGNISEWSVVRSFSITP